MQRFLLSVLCIALLILSTLIISCNQKKDPPSGPEFTMLSSAKTGLHFNNNLEPNVELNIFDYMYFYNGGGVAVADFNRDGYLDLYFTGNQRSNALYINKKNLTFTDVTEISGATGEGGWSTGVTITDINDDGWPDIYVSQVGDYRKLNGHNRLYVWQSLTREGIPVYKESSIAYGLDLVGFGTQAGFFDYDNDGDLDLFQVNHSVHLNGTFGRRQDFMGTCHDRAGDRLFRNDDGKFTDVTESSGILSTTIGYGLGLAFSDINNDGWTDIYVTNDFHENDYLYINQQNGSFKESINEMVRHTSRYSMGVDIADINNDGYNEIFTLDMRPEDPYILKSSLGEDDYGEFLFKLNFGYNYQYARNTLQLNNRNNTFSEIGIYAHVFASDWSWATLFVDFDDDGYKDIYVSNGIPKRMNDIDYVNYISNNEIHWKINMDQMKDSDLVVEQKLPSIKLKNRFYKNNRNLTFTDISESISENLPCFSNGAAYGDFDNDGDLDIVVNNIRDEVFLYQNNRNESPADNHHYININLSGPGGNPMAIGTKVIAYKNDEILSSEQYPVRGYLSFNSPVLHLGLGDIKDLDSLHLIWPDHSVLVIPLDSIDRTVSLTYQKNLPKHIYHASTFDTPVYQDITEASGIHYIHKENEFVEFNREQLIPHMTSTEGPALAIGDINMDGLDDFFVGSSKRKKSAVYVQQTDGTFIDMTGKVILNDSVYEDVDALFADIENDGDPDLVVASGGNEYTGTSEALKQRIYLNDGKGNFTSDSTAIPKIYLTAGCVAAHDINGDGYVDLFFGGRAVPWNYGHIPVSYLLLNDGHGHFSDVTSTYAPALANAGLVKDGIFADMDQDGDQDLVIAVEWGPLQIYYQQADKHFQKKEIPGSSGWWNFIAPYDFDGDGDLDFVAGNLGLNSILHASAQKPVRLYVNDFDHNGQIEQIMTYYIGNEEIVFPTHREVTKQLPSLKKKFLFAKDFAKADLTDLVGPELIKNSQILTVAQFENSYFENVNNKGTFIQHPLPESLQFSPLRAAGLIDFDRDGKQDLILGGNYYENNIELGRYDADYGSVLINSPSGLYQGALKNLSFDGQVRKINLIHVHGKDCYLIAFNNGPLRLIKFNPY